MNLHSTKKSWQRLLSVILLVVFSFSTVGAASAAAGPPAVRTASDYQAFFDDFLQAQLTSEHIAGATVAVVQDGALAFAKGYGYADVEAGIPVQADQTMFFIGSDGKLFTWTAVMQLVEQGQLDLHADVNTYLDFEIPAAFDEPVTLHHLMTHTAGFEEELNALFVAGPDHLLPLREHLVRHMPARVYAPGVVSAYSNYGTALAGYIVERVSGQPFETYLTAHLLQPLGMNHSFAGNSLPAALANNLSKGYRAQNGSDLGVDMEWTAAVPCAPLRTTATDLSRFMIAHLNEGCVDGACILSAATLETMHRQQFTHHPQLTGFTYGFMEMEVNGQRLLWHQGESARFITVLALIPAQKLGLVISYNSSPVNWRAALTAFMDTFFPADPTQREQRALPGWEAHAARFNGVYTPARSAHTTPQLLARYIATAPVAVEQGRLAFSGWNFVETEPGIFRQVDGARVLTFREDGSGQRWLFVGPLAYFQVPWYETPGFLLALLGGILLIFLSAGAAWTMRALRRGRQAPGTGRAALWLAGGLGLFDLGLLTWYVLLLLNLSEHFIFDQADARTIVTLYWLALPWTLLVLGFAVRAWLRREWTTAWRVHYSLVAITAAALLWLLWNLNLLGGRI